MDRKFALLQMPASGGAWKGGRLSKSQFPPLTISGQDRLQTREGLHAETAQSARTVVLKSVIAGLTTAILVVVGTVNLRFQGRLVSISWRPIRGIVAAYVVAIVRSSCS